MRATMQHDAGADSLLGKAILAVRSRQASQDAAGARWVTGARKRKDLQDAARAGAETADLVVRSQLEAGMDPDRIEMSAEQVLAGRFTSPSPVSDAFYDAYDETARTYMAEARPEMEAG